jgi:hypothetical protein
MKCTVFLRGGQQQQFKAATIGELRSSAILQHVRIHEIQIGQRRGGGAPETALLPSNQEIVLFKKASAEILDDDGKQLDSGMGKEYIAYEKFKVVPVDLYRTVKFSQVHPAVEVEHDSTQLQFTNVAPLFCASLNEQEALRFALLVEK